jgi:hypothetical protein
MDDRNPPATDGTTPVAVTVHASYVTFKES